MQRVLNYGSFLQAYSLKRILEGFGHEVEFLDIIPGKQLSIHNRGKNNKYIEILKKLISKFDSLLLIRIYQKFFGIFFRYKFVNNWIPM